MTLQKLLQQVLAFVISDDYYVEEDWMVFGWEAYLREHSPSVLDDRTGDEVAQDELRQEISTVNAWLARRFAVSREGLTPFHGSTAERIWREIRSDYPSAIERGTELHYALGLVSRLSDASNRSARLDETEPRSLAPPELDHLIREATTCYLYGLFDATTILCRSALQRALEIRIERDVPTLRLEVLAKERWLHSLVSVAEDNRLFAEKGDGGIARDLDAQTEKLVAHVNSDKCEQILDMTRKLVASLY